MNRVIVKNILNLFKFIDQILNLPKSSEIQFWQELKVYEEDQKIPYVTSVERIGYDRGKVEGQEEKAIAIALNMIQDKLTLETIARFTGLTIAQLQQL